ncbi:MULTISPECIES: BrnA antitoxin family protein [Thiothrix]|jgi:hypothetical protein|uniref:BrnA antitoxin family protein n=2 Tax=Thiothrix TaxID=1030 RepID=A0ABY3SUR9_9GAMM|nr:MULTISPECIES: BrnA antitoxin family protein [Thiothrix]UJS23155.1 BrnA antitoxin family protein [Thiothrix winogradskyi]WML90450.1 BrnA antitoxin family protein [Thiothrix lacustris]WMP17897.1 BrnA antitoxin family protein [Thiothrix lacustris]
MKDEYDFSKGVRGQFFHPDTHLNIPVYLDQDVETWFVERAKAKGIDVQQLVNDLLRKDISLIQSAMG